MKKFIILLLPVFLLFFAGCGEQGLDYTSFAKCLTEKGVKMYGSITCSHCQKQKDEMGEAFKYITYIECHPQADLEGAKQCLADKIEGYPTWRLADGTDLLGAQDFKQMGLRVGCEAPETEEEN